MDAKAHFSAKLGEAKGGAGSSYAILLASPCPRRPPSFPDPGGGRGTGKGCIPCYTREDVEAERACCAHGFLPPLCGDNPPKGEPQRCVIDSVDDASPLPGCPLGTGGAKRSPPPIHRKVTRGRGDAAPDEVPFQGHYVEGSNAPGVFIGGELLIPRPTPSPAVNTFR